MVEDGDEADMLDGFGGLRMAVNMQERRRPKERLDAKYYADLLE
jgi:hypothetical protein